MESLAWMPYASQGVKGTDDDDDDDDDDYENCLIKYCKSYVLRGKDKLHTKF